MILKNERGKKMKRNWKLLLSALLLAGALAFTACGSDDAGGTAENGGAGGNGGPAQTVQDDTPPERTLGGMQIVIGNWWSDYDTDAFEPRNDNERLRLEDRLRVQERYDFRIRERNLGGHSAVQTMAAIHHTTGEREVHIWILEPPTWGTFHENRLVAPIPIDLFHEGEAMGIHWNWEMLDWSTRGGNPHGWAANISPGAGGVYWNMRHFEEIGLPGDYLFTLQANNEWTWDKFVELGLQLTRDLTGDGIMDTWALTTFHRDLFPRALASNNAAFIDVDPATGDFVNATTRPEFMEALEWVVSLRELNIAAMEWDFGDAEWNYFVDAFNNGIGAMRVAGHYVAGAHVMPHLRDAWGFAAFPRGPRADHHYAFNRDQFMSISAAFNEQEVRDIMFAYLRWIRPLEGIDAGDDDWMIDQFANFYDMRSVTETMANFTRNFDLHRLPLHEMVPGGMPDADWFAFRVWNDLHTPAYILDAAQAIWEDELVRVNNAMREFR
jgi:hypothetical protein